MHAGCPVWTVCRAFHLQENDLSDTPGAKTKMTGASKGPADSHLKMSKHPGGTDRVRGPFFEMCEDFVVIFNL